MTGPAAASEPTELRVLASGEWRARAEAHARRADAFSAGWRSRRPKQLPHAIDDFLFTYYPTKPGKLRRWHPGAGVALAGADERAAWRDYRAVGMQDARGRAVGDRAVTVDATAVLGREHVQAGWIEGLIRRTRDREARFGCFGLHEWAMVYRQRPDEVRHELPLRLGHDGTDAVVEANDIACTHFDAYRFFTPAAEPRNRFRPTRAEQPELEQSGCLHANMDLYRWAMRFGPIVPGELLLDAFELARDVRELDMRASPYDVSEYGLEPVAIETREGKREYAAAQRTFATRGDELRVRLLAAIERARAFAGDASPGTRAIPPRRGVVVTPASAPR
ncbi:hypothetical protein GCM10011490_09820 [Pseudoclavibacter endophyticus]|uniref:3-methyladenine DNA glycosylase n=1 Tax=Pseudoclavibacter endophyticus TaxID=1778590 RepID=UPI001998113F|nr:3-methyladenine DNA glycosylase [Pseudoclavibacter endophyticus]GGA61566.1 hypothetical protein GCM10011490_09820 [Pseudoclavibacter endophyticus]